MARSRGRPTVGIELSEGERETLERYVRRHTASQRLVQRALVVLACAEGLSNKEVSVEVGLSPHSVGKWRRRFAENGLDVLHDSPRPGAPRSLDDDKVEEVIVKTLETTPKGATHWSTRQMAKHVGISHDSVGRIWRAFGLKPHRTDTFQLSSDPLFVEVVISMPPSLRPCRDPTVRSPAQLKSFLWTLHRFHHALHATVSQPTAIRFYGICLHLK